ncbi:unnamed protein product [Caenorhabditis bovis]|uniref:MADF domain-containing protein n=1 Tax=Caenorhabditis bovis TaxID=2654633 RepID=A0A8S1ERM6_9PELO|nr:unnamed protein product [Caenorhabditis bovis]
MSFQPAFNARLIAEVQKHPCLYNHSRRGSGDSLDRQRLWESIAKNIDGNCTAEFAKKRWLQLRDRYRKELKLAIKNNFVQPVRWCYFSQLSWLHPYLKDNIVIGVDDVKTKHELCESPTFNWFDLSNLSAVKDEMEEGEEESSMESSVLDRLLAAQRVHSISPDCDDSDPALESSVLDRLIASHRMNSNSPEFDKSGTHSPDNDDRDIDSSPMPRETGSGDGATVTQPDVIVKPKNEDSEESKVKTEAEDGKTSLSMVLDSIPKPAANPSVEALIAANNARFAQHLAAHFSGLPQAAINASKRSETAATPQNFCNESQTTSSIVNTHPYKNFAYKEHYRMKQHNRQNAEQLMKANLQNVGKAAIAWLNDEDLLYSRIIGLKLKKMDPKKRKKVRSQIMMLLEDSDEGEHDDSCSSHTQSARDNDEDCPIEPMDSTENEPEINASAAAPPTEA